MHKDNILKDLKKIRASVSAVIDQIEAENKDVSATVADIRKFAILEEVYRAGGKVTANDISDFAVKYGRTPGSCGGYYSGNSPSMTGKGDDERIPKSLLKPNWFTGEGRYLTRDGLYLVEKKRAEWGEDWLKRIPLNIVSSEIDVLTVVSF